ncbi:unnamed protein product, partial [Laminaria digitata]
MDALEGGWAATATVDSFLPVSLLVRNPSPWPIEVEIQVTSRAEGSQTSRAWGDDDDDSAEPGQIMWSGMPRRRLGKIAPGSCMCHCLMACFLTPGDVSIGFTCRVKVESASAPYGSTAFAATPGRPGIAGSGNGAKRDRTGGDDGGWHPVSCHLPLNVSVLSRKKEA